MEINTLGRILEYHCVHNSSPGSTRVDHKPNTRQVYQATCCILSTDVGDSNQR